MITPFVRAQRCDNSAVVVVGRKREQRLNTSSSDCQVWQQNLDSPIFDQPSCQPAVEYGPGY